MIDTFARRADALARRSYYEATIRRPADDPVLDDALDVDVCVIGAGFAGLSTALDCRARGLSVAVLDAYRPGWGASGRNGGQLIARIAPVASYIVATEALGADRANALISRRDAVCDNNFFLDYFRLSADHRMLFGGRASSAGASPDALVGAIRSRMIGAFPQLADVRIEFAWGGFVDVTRNRAPDFGAIDPNYFYLQGFSGHGVALTGIAGRIVAHAIAGDARAFDLFARLRHRRFPGGPAWRQPALALGMLYHRARELLF
ncbi:FAD-dependent oxidoreductase [Burkholderia sp. MSMB1589WGS]|uniref:FAD-dependent oxidoreductase n=1 Tax=Burkholderia sp. MSMB1589WGS TaxID=1636425 RepID=UPI0007B83900|nr:FAD-dependent oxidoreductase [Burkholderia sp. MSMB1589WGS]